MNKTHWSDDEIDRLITLAQDRNISLGDLALALDRPRNGVSRMISVLQRYGCAIPKRRRNRQYPLNLEFFRTDSSDLWYWVGFFAADGNICGSCVSIALSIKDAEHLQRISSLFSGAPIHTKNDGKMVKWAIYNVELCAILRDRFLLGPRKTWTLEFPDVPDRFLWDFVRGFWDGDGSFFVHGGTLGGDTLCGSYLFFKCLCKVFDKFSIEYRVNMTNNGSVWRLRTNTENTRKLASFLYQTNGCLHLARKKVIVDRFTNSNDYYSTVDIAREFGVTLDMIDHWRKKFEIPHRMKNGRGFYFGNEEMVVWRALRDLWVSYINSRGGTLQSKFRYSFFLNDPYYSTKIEVIRDAYEAAKHENAVAS